MAPSIKTKYNEEKKLDEEREIWESMLPAAWHTSITAKDSIFCKTYELTRKQIEQVAQRGDHDCIIEIGCGTGDVIGELETSIQCYGLDINPMFIDFCLENHPHDHCDFLVQDACELTNWWKQLEGKYTKPLVLCVNNTLNIMPQEIRGKVVAQMLAVAGKEGRCLCTYWNGTFFSHAVMNYYQRNQDLCGEFDMSDVDWENRELVTPSGYSTSWLFPEEVQKRLRSYDADIDTIFDGVNNKCSVSEGASNEDTPQDLVCQDHINTEGLAIFVWFSESSTSKAKGYYDSDDAQTFYKSIWGNETTHIGRYDLLTKEDKTRLSNHEQITRAEQLHEVEFIKLIRSKFPGQEKIRVLDMGCGFGGLLRRLWEAGIIWSATGCDIASKMCEQNRALNAELGCDKDIMVLEESYLGVSVKSESVDLVISMDALLHVGPNKHHKAMKEAARVLRPGGWMIFTDILQQEVVDPVEMQPIYDRIHLSKLGTVSNYKDAMEVVGFRNFKFDSHSSNVPAHYGTIREVLIEKANSIGVSKDYAVRMEAGLQTWRDLAPKNIVWGFLSAQKTEKVADLEQEE
jgi:sarcosine/dimethylglycine N-methyltransferase